jgi:hypothetical protein
MARSLLFLASLLWSAAEESRKSLIVISFLPGGMDVRDRSEAAQRADRVIRRCIHQGYGLVESRPFNVLIEYRALVDLITAERVH